MTQRTADSQPRRRAHARGLRWAIPEPNTAPVWGDANELRASLERLLDSDEKRGAASRLVLGWQMLQAIGCHEATLAEANAVGNAGAFRADVRRLVTLVSELNTQASTLADQTGDPRLRVLCAELVMHSQRDVSRIRQQLLWTEGT